MKIENQRTAALRSLVVAQRQTMTTQYREFSDAFGWFVFHRISDASSDWACFNVFECVGAHVGTEIRIVRCDARYRLNTFLIGHSAVATTMHHIHFSYEQIKWWWWWWSSIDRPMYINPPIFSLVVCDAISILLLSSPLLLWAFLIRCTGYAIFLLLCLTVQITLPCTLHTDVKAFAYSVALEHYIEFTENSKSHYTSSLNDH